MPPDKECPPAAEESLHGLNNHRDALTTADARRRHTIFLSSAAQLHQQRQQQARAAGELAADEDCDNLATFIANAWQGVLARLKVGRSLQPLESFIQRLELLLRP